MKSIFFHFVTFHGTCCDESMAELLITEVFFCYFFSETLGNHSVVISAAATTDGGNYRCQALNLIGRADSAVSVVVDGKSTARFSHFSFAKTKLVSVLAPLQIAIAVCVDRAIIDYLSAVYFSNAVSKLRDSIRLDRRRLFVDYD